MSFINSGRQEVISAVSKITFGVDKDVSTQGTFPGLSLPEGAMVLRGFLNVVTPTTAGATLTLGTYLAGVALDAADVTNLTIDPADIVDPSVVVDAVIGGADPVLDGEAYLVVEYVVADRVAFSQGLDK